MIEVFQSLTWKRLTLLSPEHVQCACLENAVMLEGNLRGYWEEKWREEEKKGEGKRESEERKGKIEERERGKGGEREKRKWEEL